MVIKQEELDLGKFTTEEVDGGKNFKKAWFNYDKKLPVIELEGTFSAYSNVFEGKRGLEWISVKLILTLEVFRRSCLSWLERAFLQILSYLR